ncbi:CARDB domain-containing protein [Oceanicoccus sp. KOV_DT_Chl]|uniref:CARDB domain-containing protein n=1 Tax=Oceanicoccus sp. KOV_DT_Chl TaxID=1904639 RepID=UPI000C7D20F5|nr:CARDB domain-containing protein [Oceanicoccus sp. KOV_DT_Chl]
MKTLNLLVSAMLLTTFTMGTLAASPNGPKPKCKMGEIPVLKSGSWVCAEPGIQAQTNAQEGRASTAKVSRATPPPARAMPDLSIANMLKLQSPAANIDAFKVYVKNTGSMKSAPCKMSLSSTNGGGELSVESIPANSGKWVEVSFAAFKDGSRIKLVVDSQKKVTESDEKNNTYAFNW